MLLSSAVSDDKGSQSLRSRYGCDNPQNLCWSEEAFPQRGCSRKFNPKYFIINTLVSVGTGDCGCDQSDRLTRTPTAPLSWFKDSSAIRLLFILSSLYASGCPQNLIFETFRFLKNLIVPFLFSYFLPSIQWRRGKMPKKAPSPKMASPQYSYMKMLYTSNQPSNQ